jgi:hypothetical protein
MGYNRERQLVCEGNCNENLIVRYDAGVRKGIRDTRNGQVNHQKQGAVLVPEWALAIARHLKHTSHARLNRDQSICLTCNTIRKYDWPIEGEGFAEPREPEETEPQEAEELVADAEYFRSGTRYPGQ